MAEVRFRAQAGRWSVHGEDVNVSDESVIAQKGPYQVELVGGKAYFYCRCGRSQKQPFCDGAHSATDIQPLRFVPAESGTYNLCGCKTTDDAPYCDGSHNLL